MSEEERRHDGRKAYELASDTGNSVRGIVHLREADERPLDPKTVYRSMSRLTRMLEHLPEAVTRLRVTALHQQDAGERTVLAGLPASRPLTLLHPAAPECIMEVVARGHVRGHLRPTSAASQTPARASTAVGPGARPEDPMSTERTKNTSTADRADSDDGSRVPAMGDDERENREHIAATGEPKRDPLGNADGAS